MMIMPYNDIGELKLFSIYVISNMTLVLVYLEVLSSSCIYVLFLYLLLLAYMRVIPIYSSHLIIVKSCLSHLISLTNICVGHWP